MERFRPNIVLDGLDEHDEDRMDAMHIATADGTVVLKPVKPCARCPIPNIDPATATSRPGRRRHAADLPGRPAGRGGITFGMNAITVDGIDRMCGSASRSRAALQFD